MIVATPFLIALLVGGAGAVVTPSSEVHASLLELAQDTVKAHQDFIRLRIEARALKGSNDEAWARKIWEAEQRAMSFAVGARALIVRVSEEYQVGPNGLAIGQSAVAQWGPLAGERIFWDPDVLAEDSLYFSFTDRNGNIHYAGDEGLTSTEGVTWPNGRVSIMLNLIQTCVETGNVGAIAEILDHEAYHFEALVNGEQPVLQEEEIAAHQRNLDRAHLYGVGEDRRESSRISIERYRASLREEPVIDRFASPERERIIAERFQAFQADLSAIRREEERIKRSVELASDIRTADQLAAKACSGVELDLMDMGGIACLERSAYAREFQSRRSPPEDGLANCAEALAHDILRSLAQTGCVGSSFINECAAVRRDQARWKQEKEYIAGNARTCKFKLLRIQGAIAGFGEYPEGSSAPDFLYRFNGEGDAEGLAATMLLARACLRVTEYKHNMNLPGWDPLCNDAWEVLDRRWNEPRLQDFLLLNTRNQTQELCMERVLSELRPPISRASFVLAVMRAASLHALDLKQRERARKMNEELDRRNARIREANRRTEERQREREARGEPRGPDGLDLSPAERAIDRWRHGLPRF